MSAPIKLPSAEAALLLKIRALLDSGFAEGVKIDLITKEIAKYEDE